MAGRDGEPMALVRTTLPDEASARALARDLVDGELAACVHVLPLRSTYRWKGAVEEEAEWLVEARTLQDRVAEVRARMREGHPHQVPLIEVIEPTRVSPAYWAWARAETWGPPRPGDGDEAR